MYKIYEVTTKSGDTYIGQTQNIAKRMWEHRNGRHSPLKPGEYDFYEILDEVEDEYAATVGEIYWTRMLRPTLNKKIGGDLPKKEFTLKELKEIYDENF